jgi:hypothetical protein
VSGDYLLWWTRGSRLPPLVTTGPAGAAARGTLGAPGTALLVGDQEADGQARSGGRLVVTLWLDPEQRLGLEARGFLLGQTSTNFAADSNAFPVLARPIFVADRGAEGRQLLATPGSASGEGLDLRGQVAVDSPSRLWGAGFGLRGNVMEDPALRLDVLLGFRHLGLDEGLHITTDTFSLRAVPGVPALDVGNRLAVTDRFDTWNRFYGGQAGLCGAWHRGRWSVEGRAGVALGVSDETVEVAGSRTFTTAAGQQQPGGLLALPSNSGRFSQDRFAVAPEAGVKVSYQVADGLLAYLGYDLLYWGNVLRPADQVDRSVDPRQVSGLLPPSPAGLNPVVHPVLPFRESGFWVQGLSAGVEVRY